MDYLVIILNTTGTLYAIMYWELKPKYRTFVVGYWASYLVG